MLDADVGLRLGPLDLEVALGARAGEVVAVLGPNGAGKTTLLRALAGLVPLQRGHVAVDGTVLEDPAAGIDVPPEDRPVGLVPQGSLLFPHLSALDNVAFGLRAAGRSRRDARSRAQGWLDRLGLAARAAARAPTLSGGEAQRVALARALAVEPRVLLLDEPLSALDAPARRDLRRDLAGVLRADGARVLVTHDPVEAMVLADRLVVLEAGRAVQAGTAEELRRRPRSAYVASLVGLNLYRGRAHEGRVELEGGGSLTAAERKVAGAVLVTVAPSAVALHAAVPEGSPRNVVAGVVRGVDVEGDRVRVRLDGPVPVVAEITPGALADLGLREGAAAWASVKATEVGIEPA